jgi:hypothetical protein
MFYSLLFYGLQVISNYHLYVASRSCGVDKYLRAAALSNGKQTLMFSPSGRSCRRDGRAELSCWNLGLNPTIDTPYEGSRPDVDIGVQRKTIRSQPTTPASLNISQALRPPSLSPSLSLPVSTPFVSSSPVFTPHAEGFFPPPSAADTAKEPRGWFKKRHPSVLDTADGTDEGGASASLIESHRVAVRAVEGAGAAAGCLVGMGTESAGGRGQVEATDCALRDDILTSTTFTPVATSTTMGGSENLDCILRASARRAGHSTSGSPVECLSRNTVSPLNTASYPGSCNDSANEGSDERCRKRTRGKRAPVDTGYVGISSVTVKVKALADMIEALIGAFYTHGGVQGGVAAIMALGAWPGMIRQDPSSELKMNGSNNVSSPSASESSLMCSDGHSGSNSKIHISPQVNIPVGYSEELRVKALDEVPPTTALREIICPASASMCATMERKLGYRFTDPCLLALALTHSSVSKNSNQRLEFLGDAVLDFVVVRELHR